MYRVILVDDEPVIRKGLRETIEWDSLGLEVAGEAANGEEALQLVETIRPEILITDIRMPKLSGIELIQEIRNRNYDVKITILSGYSDYDYLKAAIRLGVNNYLLKPIDNDELISDLKNAVSEIEREAVIDLRNRQGTELLRFNTLRRLVNGNISPEELRDKAEFLNIAISSDVYACAVCAIGQQATHEQRERFSQDIVRNAFEYFSEESTIAFIDSNGDPVLLTTNTNVENQSVTRQMFEKMVAKASKDYGVSLMIGVGRVVDSLQKIPTAYATARESMEYCVFLNSSGVVYYDTILETPRSAPTIDQIDFEQMKGYIRHGERELLKENLSFQLESITNGATLSPAQTQNLIMHLAVRLNDCFREIYGGMNAFKEVESFDFAQLFMFHRYSEMNSWMMQLCDRLFAENEVIPGKSTSIVGMAVAYINKHYREGVTLKQVAAECHINTSYLGQIFRKEMGCAFTDYVNNLRIKEAQRLLTNPTLKVYEIAEKVGFTDYHYFLKIYRKVTNTTPTDARS